MKKTVLLLFALLLFLAAISLTACNDAPSTSDASSASQDTSDEALDTTGDTVTTTAMFLFDGEYEAIVPKPSMPEEVHVIARPASNDDLLTLVSAQGLLAKNSTQRIMIRHDSQASAFISVIKSTYSDVCKVSTTGAMWSFLKKNASHFSGYILTDLGDESINVATSLAGVLNALILTPENRHYAQNLELSLLLDVTDKDDAWLRDSEHFDKLNRNVAFMLTPSGVEFLRDYAIFCGAYMFADTDTAANTLMSQISFLNDNFVIFGWNNNLGEHGTVQAISTLNGSMVPADWAKNLATLASFPISEAHQKTEEDASDAQNKHTVCLVMSDGDNLQWTMGDELSSSKWYGSNHRGDFTMSWGLPATLIDVASPVFAYYYRTMKPNEEFIMQLSGTGYTFPSKWKNMNALAAMQADVAEAMKRADISVMEVLDDVTLNNSSVNRYYKGFLESDAVDGILYIDYGNYAAYNGKIFWCGDKPLVTARYRLWADVAGNADPQSIAKAINAASTDVTKADAYSFVIIHAWSGLDSSGNLVNGGNTMDAVAELVSLLDEDVELVTPSEFMARITENVSH